MNTQSQGLAKITWEDPATQEKKEFVLAEGATATIGRASTNDIAIPERHVSRQHAVITFRDGVFTIADLGTVNGTFVNDRRLMEAFPLAHGDVIRLFVPILTFSAIVTEEDEANARKTGTWIGVASTEGLPRLIVTKGVQEGIEFPFYQDMMMLGRTTADTNWDIALQDRAVSRPHCRFSRRSDSWYVMDLGSANGTILNDAAVTADPRELKDGDVLQIGETTLLFRQPGI